MHTKDEETDAEVYAVGTRVEAIIILLGRSHS